MATVVAPTHVYVVHSIYILLGWECLKSRTMRGVGCFFHILRKSMLEVGYFFHSMSMLGGGGGCVRPSTADSCWVGVRCLDSTKCWV